MAGRDGKEKWRLFSFWLPCRVSREVSRYGSPRGMTKMSESPPPRVDEVSRTSSALFLLRVARPKVFRRAWSCVI